jgi:phospholipase C
MTPTPKFLLPLVFLSTAFAILLAPSLFAQTGAATPKSFSFPKQVTHVVVIFQENRTPDNLFHFLTPLCPIPSGATGAAACSPSPVTTSCYDVSPCGLSNQSGTETPITLTGVPMKGSTDPDHSHSAFMTMCDPDAAAGYACQNDGAWGVKQSGMVETSYSYVENSNVTNYNGSKGHLLDPYLTYAEQYGWANFMYQTNQGPSYPAHQFIFSGTSALSRADDRSSIFVAENFGPPGTGYGCLAGADTKTHLIYPLLPDETLCKGGTAYDDNSIQECLVENTALNNPPGNAVGSFCSNKPTMGSVLDTHKISWKYYAPSAGDLWTAPDAIADICVPKFTTKGDTTLECSGAEWAANVDLKLKGADVLNDITNCNLAGVSWIIPDGTWSDHAGSTENWGPSWVTAIINEIGQHATCAAGTIDAGQTFWQNTAIVLTWDDWGGWSDNQKPPLLSKLPCTTDNCQADYQYGFRVPLVIISAYTPKGYISDRTYDFGSVLRMIEGVNGIAEGTLGVADARASTDLSDFFQGAFRVYTPVPALLAPSFFLGEEAQKGAATPPDNDGDDD